MEQFVYVILRGIAIGILISAPMGPIGMLVIQRTLNKGRGAAFSTGVGAAISDLFYCLLTGLGLSFVTDFIEAHQLILQAFGSIVLAAFGVYLFSKNPVRSLSTPMTATASTYWKDFVTGFLFTFSNPLILFFIIGLFARFNFMLPEFKYYHVGAGFISIFAGALMWWFVVTYFVNKVRSHFNVRSLWLVNRTIGSIIIIMAIVGLFMSVYDYVTSTLV
jgi:threonine/homoserine/homoserine lactone efflux protein